MGLKEQIIVGLEGTINDKKKKYIDKVNSLLSAWEHLSVFIPQSSSEASENLFSYVHKYTLQLLLHGDWPKLNQAVKTHLGVILHRCVGLLSKINAEVANKCCSLINLVHDPWKHPTLHKILHNLPTTEEEVNVFFEEEGSQLLVMRLEVLCESKCEDLALSLAESCFRYLRHSNVSQSSHVIYIRDVLLALLFRYKRNHDIITQLKLLDLQEGLNLVQRYAKRSNEGPRIWRNSDKVAEIAAHAILASAMVQCVEDPEKQQLLYDLIKEWVLIHIPKRSPTNQTIQNMIRKMIQTAESSLHIYIFCKVLINEFSDDLKSLCVELYIKGLTANMNEIEQQKMKNDKKKIYDCEVRLSNGFLQLADLLNNNVIVCRECVLTAFSLNPTRSCLERIKALAITCRKPEHPDSELGPREFNAVEYDSQVIQDRLDGRQSQDMKISPLKEDSSQGVKKHSISSHQSNVSPLDVGPMKEVCSECGHKDNSPIKENFENSSTYNNLSILEPETLGLAPHLCDDLSTVLSCPRYHTLHWSMDWKELSSKCEKYLEEYDSRRNATTELKYLNIDYSQFKDWPEDDDNLYCGIEKGYEQWIDYDDETDNPKDKSVSFSTPVRSDNKGISSTNIMTLEEKASKNKKQPNNKSNSLNCDFALNEKVELPNKNNIKLLTINNVDDEQPVGNTVGSFNLKSDFERIKGMKKKSYEKSALRLQRMKKKEPQPFELKDKNQSICNSVSSLFNNIDAGKSSLKNNVCKRPISSILKVSKPVSDPNVLKTLRMFRFTDNRRSSNSVPPVKPVAVEPPIVPFIDVTGIKVKDEQPSAANLNPKVLTIPDIDCSNKKTENIQSEKIAKFRLDNIDLGSKPRISEKVNKLDILAQAVMSSDILLANSVPGLNSLDMIIPESHEPTVQVFHLPTSASNSIVSQNCIVSSSTDTSTNNSFLNRNKPHTDTQTTDLMTSPTNSVVTTSPHSSNLYSNNTSQTSVAYLPSSDAPSVTIEHRSAATPNASPLTSIVLSTRVPKHCKQQASVNQTANTQPQSSTCSSALRQLPITTATPLLCTTNQILSSSQVINTIISSSEGSTQVSTRVSRSDFPTKQTKVVECNSQSVKLCTSVSTQSAKGSEETMKTVNQLQPNSILRFIVKDGSTTTEEHYARNFLSDINSPENEASKQTHTVKLSQEQIIRLIKRRKETKNKPEKSASLPKFDHVFGRQVYQPGTDESNETRSEFMAVEGEKEVVLATPCMSKGVQTALKDKDCPEKKSERLKPEINLIVQENGASNTAVRLPSSDSKANSDVKTVSDLQSPPGVIFTCKVPVTISSTNLLQRNSVTLLKTNSSQELIMQGSSKFETDSQSKESVIRSNMNALLAAALQSPSPLRPSASQPDILSSNSTSEAPSVSPSSHLGSGSDKPIENISDSTKSKMQSPASKTIRRQPLVPQRLQRFTRPLLHVSAGSSGSQTNNAVVSCIPLPLRTVQVLTANLNQSIPNAKLETRKEQVSLSPVEQPSVSSTTLEQLREFESVLEQVTNTSQMKEKCNTSKANTEDQVQHSHNTDSDFSSSSKQNTIFSSSLDNTLSDSSSERSGATFINKTPGNSTNSIRNSSPSKITATTPVVVVQSSNRSVVSPALSITPPSSSSPAHSGVATSSQTKINSKVNKPKSKPVGKTTPTTNTVKVSTLPKPQQKPQEDEQTTQRIYAILDKYAEQLRNSPELKNKPAPRRRSNPSSNSSQSSKRKKTSQNKTKATSSLSKCSGVELSPGSEDVLTVGSEDSSNGLSQISQVMSSPQSHLDELSTPTGDVSSETSESLDSKEPRLQHRSLITESGKGSARTVVVQENVQDSVNVVDTTKVFDAKQVVGNSGTVPLTLSLPGAGNLKQVIFPMPADGRQFVVAKMPKMYRVHQVSGSPLLATTGSGAVVLRQMCINKAGTNIKQVKVPVVTSISPQNVISKQPTVVLPSGTQTFTLATNSCTENTESLGIAFDNTLLLNASTAGSSISFVQRNLAKPLLPTSGLVATTSLSPIQDSSVSVPSSTSDITVTTLKSENASVSTTCAPSKTDNDGKSDKQSKEKFVITSSGGSGVVPRTTSSKSWSQVLTDVMNRRNGEKVMKDVDDNKKFIKLTPTNTILKADSTSQKGTSEIWRFTDSRIEMLGNGQKAFSPQLQDVESKPSEVDTCFQYNSTRILPNSQCLRQKSCNGENTIFQIAFRKVDKNKPSLKEDCLQQKSTIERERFQKSLSDECEDLGVDKPSTSDLFPEAELLLDSDPLSRDSLPGELSSRGLESSSSSHDSPSRSPILATRFKSCHWKKQKRNLLRHQVTGVEKLVWETSSSYTSRNPNLYDEMKQKSARCNSPINKDPDHSHFDMQEAGNEIESCSSDRTSPLVNKCSDKNVTFPDDLESHGNSRDSESDCNNSDEEEEEEDDDDDDDNCECCGEGDNCKEPGQNENSESALVLMDCGSKSLNDSCNSEESQSLVKESNVANLEDGLLKPILDTNKLASTCINYNKQNHYKFTNFIPKDGDQNKSESELSWYKMMRGVGFNKDSKPSLLEDGQPEVSYKASGSTDAEEESSSGFTSPNHANSESQSSKHTAISPLQDLMELGSTAGRKRQAQSPQKVCKTVKSRKRKKVSAYVLSHEEDSGSSIDTVLLDPESCQEIHRTTRRASSRGLIKKGCPCLNGSPEPTKKKKELGLCSKTEKHVSTSSLTLLMNNRKPVSKCSFKTISKKR